MMSCRLRETSSSVDKASDIAWNEGPLVYFDGRESKKQDIMLEYAFSARAKASVEAECYPSHSLLRRVVSGSSRETLDSLGKLVTVFESSVAKIREMRSAKVTERRLSMVLNCIREDFLKW